MRRFFHGRSLRFQLTALFLVIAVGQWKAVGGHLPALLGGAATLVSLLVVGAEDMLLPALAIIVIALTLLRPRLDAAAETETGKEAEHPC